MMTGQKGITTMMKRNNKKSTIKSLKSNMNYIKSRKSNMNYIKLHEFESKVRIDDGEMWLKSGKYDSPSVSVKISDEDMLSDWMRKITLRNVVLTLEENDMGYSELVISGREDDEDDDAGDE